MQFYISKKQQNKSFSLPKKIIMSKIVKKPKIQQKTDI